jgi:hypothetical protein
MPSRDLSSAIGLLRILSITQVALLLLAGLFLKLVRYYLIRPLTSPLRFLQCPPGGTGVWGHFPNMIESALSSPLLLPKLIQE